LKIVFFGAEISSIFFVRNFCRSSILPLKFGSFFENMGVSGKLTKRQWLGWPILAENLAKHCKDIYFSPKKFLSQKFLSIVKNPHFRKNYLKKNGPFGTTIIYTKFDCKNQNKRLQCVHIRHFLIHFVCC